MKTRKDFESDEKSLEAYDVGWKIGHERGYFKGRCGSEDDDDEPADSESALEKLLDTKSPEHLAQFIKKTWHPDNLERFIDSLKEKL